MGKICEWRIENGYFQPKLLSAKSYEVHQIIRALQETQLADVFLRGSILEEWMPHPKSDLDIYVFTDQNQGLPISQIIQSALHFVHRPIEIVCMNQSTFLGDIPKALLGSTRSYAIHNPFPSCQIKADYEAAKAHWLQYRPTRYQTGYPAHKSLVMSKQLFRSIGVIRLIEDQRFSRHLPTCLQWAYEIAPLNVAQNFELLWHNLAQPSWHSINIDPIIEWFKEKEVQYNLYPS